VKNGEEMSGFRVDFDFWDDLGFLKNGEEWRVFVSNLKLTE
jgi:hypothetical protein